MEYELILTVKVSPDFFYWDLNATERQTVMAETVLNAIHDIDDLNLTSIRAEELDIT